MTCETSDCVDSLKHPGYQELLDWANDRQRQWLRRRRAAAKPPALAMAACGRAAENPADRQTQDWIASWYEPPKLRAPVARLQSFVHYAPALEVQDLKVRQANEDQPAEDVKPIAKSLSVGNLNAESSIVEFSTHPQASEGVAALPVAQNLERAMPFQVGDRVQLRSGDHLADLPAGAVLQVVELAANAYRAGIWCVWCQSAAFVGLRSFNSDQLQLTAVSGDLAPMQDEDLCYQLITNPSALADLAKRWQSEPVLAIDTETTGLDPLQDRLRLVQIAVLGQPVAIVDCFQFQPEELAPLQGLLSSQAMKIFHHAKFDLKFLAQAGIRVSVPLFDTLIAVQVLDGGVRSSSYRLTDLAQRYLQASVSKAEQCSDWGQAQLTESQLVYAARDAWVLLKLQTVLGAELTNAQLMKTAQLEFSGVQAIAAIELKGMLLDLSRWQELRQRLIAEKEQAAIAARQLLSPAGTQQINLDSQLQVLAALRAIGVNLSNTNRATLLSWAETQPAAQALLAYRQAAKAVQSFADRLPQHVHPVTGRLHPDYRQLGAATGRMACRSPNLQQIPRDRRFRECFVPAPGYQFVVADYSQIELRVAAELSGDRRMVTAYQQEEDLHQVTAALLAGKSLAAVTSAERQAAKAVNFGLIYAMGAKGLADYARNAYNLAITLAEAREFRQRFFEVYQGIAAWHDQAREQLRSQRSGPWQVRTLGDRLRRWTNPPKLTEWLNTPVQGTAADITKQALARLPSALQDHDAKLIGVVHDEILLEVAIAETQPVAKILKRVMEEAGQDFLTQVPVRADVAVVASWAGK